MGCGARLGVCVGWGCGGGLTVAYVDNNYTFSVHFSSNQYCTSPVTVDVSSSSVTLASYLTQKTGCGTHRAPWRVEAEPGQRINITMLDFGWKSDGFQSTLGTPKCSVYGYILEGSLSINRTICGGTLRERHVYLSSSSNVDIAIATPKQDASNFLLNIEGTQLKADYMNLRIK